jgi:chromate reductase
METSLKILGLCGSLRVGSLNRKLVFHTCDVLKSKGCTINYIDIKDLELPLYNGDVEEKLGLPDGVNVLVKAIEEADGLVIGNPEYNGGITGVLKNTIDWASRAPKNPFHSKAILLVGTSPGWFGGIKSHFITNQILTTLRAYVMPTLVAIPQGDKALDERGQIKEANLEKNLVSGCDELLRFIKGQKSQS